MLVRILKKVPVLLDDKVVDLRPGEEHDVPDNIGDALVRGHDAELVAAAPMVEEKPAVVEPAQDERPAKKPRRQKNLGAAPENK